MRRTLRMLLFVAFFVAWALQSRSTPVLACTPPPEGFPSYTIAERIKTARIVLEGTVVDGTSQPGWPEWAPQKVTVDVKQYLKGNGPAVVTIQGFGPGSMCLSEAQIGAHLIFYANSDPETGLIHANYFHQFDATAPVSPELIAEISAAAGQAPIKPARIALFETHLDNPETKNQWVLTTLLVSFFAAIASGTGLLWMRWRRKQH
jgi:hypothetical protein